MALAAALPLCLLAQSRVPVIAAPPVKTVPVPSASWRVYGSGAAAPVNTPNAQGGVDQKIRQDSTKAIYQWGSFDIGASSSVTFDMKAAGSSALNRVIGSTAPSRIFGKLSATNGGEVYLINGNGILFGKSAQVNLGSLVASTLNVSDDEFKSGLVNAITGNDAAFRYEGLEADFVDERNFVRVDEGADIRTTAGGRVFLFAKRVENAGQITTPGGQVVLGAGGKVYLALPNAEGFDELYASESNPAIPVLRGLVVEVGSAFGANGSAVNEVSGAIATPRGNITIVGMAVNQLGRLSATTSVAENGSIILRAQGQANPAATFNKTAQAAGALQIGAGSVIEILPDDTPGADGKALTSTDTAGFIPSSIDIAGRTVRLFENSRITAPGADVDIRAEARPRYLDATPYLEGNGASRISIGANVVIDVSGTTDTVIDGARNFVTTELLGSNDLKDAPLQKEGLLFRSKVTLDTRGGSPILGDLAGYRDAEQRTVGERLAEGGSVSLVAQGGVVMRDTARIDVSGGQLRFTEAQVAPTQLMASDGTLVDLNHAPADLVYTRAYNLQKASNAEYDRWGLKVNYGGVLPSRTELGYTQGTDAGRISVIAPTAVLDGTFSAGTIQGERQQRGEADQAVAGTLALGAARNFGDFGTGTYAGAVLREVMVGASRAPVDPSFWDAPMSTPLPQPTYLSIDQLREAGFGQIDITAQNDVHIDAQAGYELPDNGQLRVRSQVGTVSLAGTVRSAGSSVELRSQLGAVDLAAGSTIDVSGRWINQQLGGPTNTSSIEGGSVTLAGVGRVNVGSGSLIDVSGGAAVSTSGAFGGGDAGRITIAAQPSSTGAAFDEPALVLGGRLEGYSLAEGGSLSITAPSVRIGTASAAASVANPASLTLDPAFFREGGFSSYAVDGKFFTDVAPGTVITASRNVFVAPIRPGLIATGTDPREAMAIGQPPLELPRTVDVSLASSGVGGTFAGGALTFGEGAVLHTPAASSVKLSAGKTLQFDGEIVDHGGDVSLVVSTPNTIQPSTVSYLWLGDRSRIDVSGVALIDPLITTGLVRGEVLAGGSVTLNANGAEGSRASSLVWKEGSQIDVRGAQAALDVTQLTAAGLATSRQRVASEGGSLAILGNKDLHLDGHLQAQGGSDAVAGGALSVSLAQSVQERDNADAFPALRQLSLTQQRVPGAAPASTSDIAASGDLAGSAGISAQLVRESGVADFSVRSHDQIVFDGPLDLRVSRELRLDTRALVSGRTGPVQLSAATVVLANGITTDEAKLNGGEQRALPVVAPGPTGLRIDAQNVVLDGRLATRGFGNLFITSAGDLRLQGANPATGAFEGALLTAANLHLDAARIYPATGTSYRIEAPGKSVEILATADNTAGKPISAGGSLIIDAQTIRQGGAVFAPHGRVELRAQADLTLAAGSITSVSGDGVIAPYGQFTDQDTWFAPDNIQRLPGSGLTAPPSKNVVLESALGSVSTEAGSTVDLSAGGEIRATQFVPGPGGSIDVFTGADGAYAIVPGIQGLAPYDRSLATTAPALGREIVIGAGGPVPAGRYMLLPARYALLPGGFLVKPDVDATGDALALGAVIAQPNGSSLVGARLADAGTGFAQALSSTWRITPLAVARQSSEIREANASTFFNDRATRAGEVAPRLPVDAGTLTIATQSATLGGATLFNRPTDVPAGAVPGRGGEVQIAADRILVTDQIVPSVTGVLALQTAQLNAMGADTLLLGAQRGTAIDNAVPLLVRASDVVVDSAGLALSVPDLVIAANERVQIGAGTVLRASAPNPGQGVEAYAITGDGAALRLSGSPGAALLRTGAQRLIGELVVDSGVVLGAATGTLVLDATSRTAIAADSRLNAADITLTAARMVVGPSVVPDPDALAIGPALTRQLGGAEAVTLRSYDAINFNDGASLSLVDGGTLTLDTPRLLAGRATEEGATVEAGHIVLANSTGTVSGGLLAGQGRLTLHAIAQDAASAEGPTGRIELGSGAVAVGGAALHAMADAQLALAGTSTLRTSGDLRLSTPVVSATDSRADATLLASGVLTIDGSAGVAGPGLAAAPVAGAALSMSGRSVDVSTHLVLPAGVVVIDATGTSAGDNLRFATGAQVDTSGRRIVLDGTAVDLSAGRISAAAQGGSVIVDSGALLNVSASGGGDAGRIELIAEQGAVQLDGALRGSAGTAGGVGAALAIDSATALDLAQLSRSITSGSRAGFDGEIAVRNREGDQVVAADVALKSALIRLQADAGALLVQGRLDASGDRGGRVELAARDDLVLADGAQLLADANVAGQAGGRVSLGSTQGEIALQQGSLIDVGGAGGAGGRVLLRAAREGATGSVAGDEVRIAAIEGEVRGASRINVEAVKVYQAQTLVAGYTPIDAPQPLDVAQLASDGEAFLGADGARATGIAQRLAAGRAAVQSQIRVHAGAEVQSSADISYQGSADWFLPDESVGSAAASPNAGDTTLTLRAAGNVLLPRSIGSGFMQRSFGGGEVRGAEPASDDSGSIRVVAGADLTAAAPLSTVRDGLGDVRIGRAEVGFQPVVAVATTTGDVQIAAARDILMRDGRAMAYTYGVGSGDPAAQAAVDAIAAVPAYRGDVPVGVNLREAVMPFREGGGDVSLTAGRDVIGRLGAPLDPGSFSVEPITLSDWRVMRHTTDAQGVETGTWWAMLPVSFDGYREWAVSARPREFIHGIATFGGGDVAVSAGRDVTNLGASAASSGHWSRGAGQAQASVHRYGGGDVSVQARRDVVNGLFFGAGDSLRVAADRDVRRRIDNPALGQAGAEFNYENTTVTVTARRDIDINGVRSAFGTGGQWMWGLDGDASLQVTATGGAVRVAPPQEPNLDGVYLEASSLIPAATQIAAPQGALTIIGAIAQQPVDDASLRLLAQGDLTIDADIRVNATRGSDRGVGYLDAGSLATSTDFYSGMGEALALQALADHGERLDRSTRVPVQVASSEGSVIFSPTRGNLTSARPVRVVAGEDVRLTRADVGISAQHQDEQFDADTQTWQPVSELSLIQAGGDLSFIGRPRIKVGGSGDLVVLAGGNIDLGSGLGIVATGNTENATVLPSGSASLTLVAGLRADGVDYALAVRKGFQALGGLGLTDRAGDLYALLDSTLPTVPLGGAAAKAFDAASLDSRLQQARDLVGASAYERSIAAYVRGLPGNDQLTDAQALAKFSSLGTSQRDPAPGIVLADAFALQNASRRVAFVASVAQAEGNDAYGGALGAYMQRVTGQSLALADAVAAFEALPLARQVPLLNQVLVEDLRRNGRVAASTGGDEAAIAYARGYRAIDALFPLESQAARPQASIGLASSQIRTLQGGDITLMAPGGSANAGETSSLSAADPSSTGIVTVAGGDISAVVRDDFLVNRSRVFSLAQGDILLWSSSGDIDAGRGAKTVVGAPAPVLRLNADGKLELDTTGSFTGSGIAVLDSTSALDLYAPQGAIDAGEAGIRASGNAFFGAQVVRGADNLQIGGAATGAPVAPPTVGNTAGLGGASQDAANRAAAGATDDEDERRKRRARRTLLLEFLGFGSRG